MTGDSHSGGLIGENGGNVTDSYAEGDVTADGSRVGGLIGENSGNVTDSYAEGDVTADGGSVGGLIGGNSSSDITGSYATGDVNSNGGRAGGLIGGNSGDVINSHAKGDVNSGGSSVGGLIGFNTIGKVTYSYAKGDVNSDGGSVGGLIGDNYKGYNVTDSHATGHVTTNGNEIGGLIGSNSGDVTNSHAQGNVKAKGNSAGGLIGRIYSGNVTISYSEGDVTAEDDRAGGFVGDNDGGSISNSYSIGNAMGIDEVGGFVGVNRDDAVIEDSYSTGTPNGASDVGGFAGLNGAEITGSYWDSQNSSTDEGVGRGSDNGVEGLQTGQMVGEDAIVNMTNFDFDEAWQIVDDIELRSYPFLQANPQDPPPSNIPEPVQLVSPEEQGTDQHTRPEFNWHEEPRADTYTLRVTNNGDFSDPVIDQELSDTTFTPDEDLAFETTYSWRVLAENQSGTSESDTWRFTTRPELPESIVLVKPGKDTVNVSLAPTFAWREDNITQTYDFQLAGSDSFSDLIIDRQELTDITLDVTDSLNYLTNYYWRVRGVGDLGAGEWSDAWSFTTIIEAPEMVQLVSPDSGSVDISIQPELSWNESERSEHYQIRLARDFEFEDIIHDSTGIEELSFLPITLQYNTDYFWKVKTMNVGGESDWSDTWSFFTEYALEQPVLVSPEHEIKDQEIPVTFQWNPVEDAKDYELQISLDDEFETLLDLGNSEEVSVAKANDSDSETIAKDQSNWTISQKVEILDFSAQYFWRVKAIGDEGISDWSDVRSLTTEDAPITTPVTLLTPDNESTEVPFPIELSWEVFEDADHYDVQVSKSSDFKQRRSFDDIDGTDFSVDDLADTTQYYWRVRATVEDQKSAWSEVWSFTTELRVPEVPVWKPDDGQQDVETSPLLSWETSDRAEMYDLQLSDDPEFSDLVVDESEIQDTEFQVSEELEKGVTYHWRVRAGNQSGYSDWSDTLSFTTVMPTDVLQEEVPEEFTLKQNYPNPFNPSTQIRFALPEQAHVTLSVYNLLGQQVATLVNETRSTGWHDVTFDASGLSSGVLIYRIEAGEYVETRSMMFVK
ncbi:MAG: GLUG motif-containing protein [Candidatus Paceibacterota bacterium]